MTPEKNADRNARRKTFREKDPPLQNDREAHESRKVRRVFQDRVDQLQHMEMMDPGEDF